MANKEDSEALGSKPSTELLDAISANRFGCFVDLPRLTDADVSVLQRILKGTEKEPVPLDRKRAIAALARSSGSPDAVLLLSDVVASTNESQRVRATAARLLSVSPPALAERALLSNLAVDDEAVRTELIASLRVVGGVDALQTLASLADVGSDALRRQLEFARLMIGLRVAPSKVNSGRTLGVIWEALKVVPIDSVRVREHLHALHDSSYGVELSSEVGFEIECSGATHVVLLNAAFERGAFLRPLRSGNAIAALVVLAEKGVAHLTVRYVVLTSPVADGVSVIVARGSGEAVYSGDAIADGAGLRLQLRDVGRERVPTEIGGMITEDTVQLELRVWRGAARPKRRPLAIPR